MPRLFGRFCERCPLRSYAERKPKSFIVRVWRWHTKWCPGWKAYQQTLADRQRQESPPEQSPAP